MDAPMNEALAIEIPEDLRGFTRLPSSPVATVAVKGCPSREAALCQLQTAWEAEGLPSQLDDDVVNEVFQAADAIVQDWHPVGSVDPDRIVFQLCEFLADDDARIWAAWQWTHQQLIFRRFDHLLPSVFQRLKQEIHNLFDELPIGRLLDWQHRMNTAFVGEPVLSAEAEAGGKEKLEPLVDPILFQKVGFEHFRTPVFSKPACNRVPVSYEDGTPVLWILHLFSGRRRRGDCHFWTECCSGVLPGFIVRILSVDTAIHPVHGNLDRGPVYDRMLRIIKKRFFAAGLTGPLCETFSAARHIDLPDQRHPRPLRSSEFPWLLADRSCREMFQVLIGTRLLFHSLIAEVSLVLAGACSLMEHPTENSDSNKVSVWRLNCHSDWVMALHEAKQHKIEQWKYGSRGIKPTTLRAVNMGPPALVEKVLEQNTDSTLVRPCYALAGKHGDGSYKTASAKEYPSHLCRAMVLATLYSLKHRIDSCGVVQALPLAADEHEWISALHACAIQDSLSGKFLPDFQG